MYITPFLPEAITFIFIDSLRNSSLGEVFKNVKEPSTQTTLRFYMPKIEHAEDSQKYLNHPDSCHEAGYDAFMSGAIFVKIAHSMAALNYM